MLWVDPFLVDAEIDLPDHEASAQYHLNQAVIEIGEAAHPVEDDTSPPHHGFQVWIGPSDGVAMLGGLGYAAFVLHHHERETADVYRNLDKDHSVDDTVAAKMHPVLLRILQL